MHDRNVEEISGSELQRLLGFWTAERIRSISVPDAGTINTVRILVTDSRSYVLRIYRHTDSQRIEREHRVVHWVRARGIPAVAPLPLANGATYLNDDGRLITLLPFVTGEQLRRDRLERAETEAMGHFLGDLHCVLADCSTSGVPAVEIALNRQDVLANIDRLEVSVRSVEKPIATDDYALRRLSARRDWLQNRSGEDVTALYSLPFQVIHGDYQESNLFFENGEVSAIIDWDKVYTAPSGWEVMRTLHLMLEFQTSPSRIFLKAYRERNALSVDELDVVAHCYGLMRAYDLWLFEEIYDVGNDRVRKFMKQGDFAPIECEWKRLRSALKDL